MAASIAPPMPAPPLAAALVGPSEPRSSQRVAIADEVLFDRALAGDRESLGDLISRYERALFGLLVRLTNGDRHRADDLFQETFLHAMRAAATFKRKMQFKPWITAIAVNLVRDEARRRKVRGEVTLDGGSEDEHAHYAEPACGRETPGQIAERRDEEVRVRAALEKLTEIEREVVLLHFYNDMTLVETAEALDVPVGTAKSRLHSALTRLSGLLERE